MSDEIKILKDLLKQVENNDYEGYDLYDLKGTELYSKNYYTNYLSTKFKRKFIDALDIFAPKLGRRLFNIKREKNAKAMGLFLMTYLNLYEIEKDSYYLEKIEYISK